MRGQLLLLFSIVSLSLAQLSPVSDFRVTYTDRYWGNYGVTQQQYQTYNIQPMSRYTYSANSQPMTEGYKWLWDRMKGRWEVGAEYHCSGKLVGYVWGQPQWLCNCRSFGGVTYQVGRKCEPYIPEDSNGRFYQAYGKK